MSEAARPRLLRSTTPLHELISVEHPGILTDPVLAVATLGGKDQVAKLVEPANGPVPASLLLRPKDPMCIPIISSHLPARSILLEFTIPRRTGRKRKRGSDDPWVADYQTSSNSCTAEELRRTLMDHQDTFEASAVAKISTVHRFRDLADFQHLSTGSPFLQSLRSTILTNDYDQIKTFALSTEQSLKSKEHILPPPQFARLNIPYRYVYQKNIASRTFIDANGEARFMNVHKPPQFFTMSVSMKDPFIPDKPHGSLPPISELHPSTQRILDQAARIFEERPIWTRRAFRNQLDFRPPDYHVREAIQYLGYLFRGGPWKDTIIKWGVDPRADPKYRCYQALSFKLDEDYLRLKIPGWTKERSKTFKRDKYDQSEKKDQNYDSHLFSGERVLLDAKGWQLCDITDKLLKNLIDTTELRTQLDEYDGWYANGILAKIKVIMREKILALLAGKVPNDIDYAPLLEYPDWITGENTTHLVRGQNANNDSEMTSLGSLIRRMAGDRGDQPYFENPPENASQASPEQDGSNHPLSTQGEARSSFSNDDDDEGSSFSFGEDQPSDSDQEEDGDENNENLRDGEQGF